MRSIGLWTSTTESIFAVHLDHGTEEVCYDCIDSGFYSSVMIDASHEDFPKNIEITRRVADRAESAGHRGQRTRALHESLAQAPIPKLCIAKLLLCPALALQTLGQPQGNRVRCCGDGE